MTTPPRRRPPPVFTTQRDGPRLLSGAAMNIVVNEQIHLSEFRSSDKTALVAFLNYSGIHHAPSASLAAHRYRSR